MKYRVMFNPPADFFERYHFQHDGSMSRAKPEWYPVVSVAGLTHEEALAYIRRQGVGPVQWAQYSIEPESS